jgi:serine/threonine protein kinase
MAPEQADPNQRDEIGPATDCYALGVVAYQMLTGQVPFPGNTPGTLNAHLHQPPPHPRSLGADLPARVCRVLSKALAKSPGERYPTATDFVDALRRAGAPETPVVSAPRARRAVLPALRWGLTALVGIAVALCLFVSMLVGPARILEFLSGQAPEPNATPTRAPTVIDTPTYTPTTTVPSTRTPTPTSTPSPTPTPELPASSPEEAVERYYQFLNNGQYDKAWAMFTLDFQQNQPANNLSEYARWAMSVKRVDLVGPITILAQNATQATVRIPFVSYVMQDDAVRNYSNLKLHLKRETLGHDWLIDGVEEG